MNDDDGRWIANFVAASTAATYEEIDHHLLTQQIPKAYGNLGRQGRSGATVRIAAKEIEVAIREKIDLRVKAERDAHLRRHIAIPTGRLLAASSDLEALARADFGRLFAQVVAPTDVNIATILMNEAVQRLQNHARTAMQLAVLESESPMVVRVDPPPPASSVYTLHVYGNVSGGVVASQIGTLNVEATTQELRACLTSLKNSIDALPAAIREEAHDLLAGLVNEAEKGPGHSRSLVSYGIGRLRTLANDAAALVTLAPYLDQVARIMFSLATTSPPIV